MNLCTILYNVSLAAPVLYFQRFKLHLSRIKVSFMYYFYVDCLAVSLVCLSLYPTKSSSSSISCHVFLFFCVMSFTTHCSDLDPSLPHGNFNFCFIFQNLRQSLQSCNIATSCWSVICQGIFPCMLVSGSS